ncbi:MBL fold metallo-hydrolase RNA specificity domain-containing protein [Pseudidiomarina taiwanensis]|uniref:MBL fold hydrolase n=1 Tax=Pseudidiomarina taiwanensis TaxID=337250 RepID=A0A432ZL41_9GAMM|nr:MBL fold metallo-hydrolase [Pseudidiomarina taiwanensis]RUO78717.1 MBL fold hydrolase [Pseudidiomarina taiwanensis]
MQILHHGAGDGVTGSCHEFFVTDRDSLLIDCGLFQGAEVAFAGSGSGSRDSAGQEIEFALDAVRGLVLTHCHIDHCGRLPWLFMAGFRAPIYCTEATAALLPLVIEDAMKVGMGAGAEAVAAMLRLLHEWLRPVGYDEWVEVSLEAEPLQMRLREAGHILGSAYVEFDVADGRRVVFSGDIGCRGTPLLNDPAPLERADVLVLESTYGDRLHESRADRAERLRLVVERAFANGGTVLVPAFSIGRTQELLYELEDLIHRYAAQDERWRKMTVILDSPLASRYTAMYRRLKPLWDAQSRARLGDDRHPLNFERLLVVESHAEHERILDYLAASGDPCIVLAASGMCTGGRIVNYLRAMLPDERTDVVFVGYQAAGTPGRDIQRYGPDGGYVILDGERVDIRAGVYTLGGYSAHADQAELLDFIGSAAGAVGEVRLVHGTEQAQAALAAKIRSRFDIRVKFASNR